MMATTPDLSRLDDREAVMRRLEALGARVSVVTEGARRRMEPDIDTRILALRARVEARQTRQREE